MKRPIHLVSGVVLLSLFLVAWFAWPHVVEHDTPICAFRNVTGRPCVFCGLTRAFACAVHGEWRDAFRYHPAWWLAAILVLGSGMMLVRDGLTGKDWTGILGRRWRIWTWPLVGMIVVLTIIRACLSGEG